MQVIDTGGRARFFSRSAPEGVRDEEENDVEAGEGERERERRERRYSCTSSGVSASLARAISAAKYHHAQPLDGGCWVAVIDLFLLLAQYGGREPEREPARVAEFFGSRDKHMAGLRFARDGCAVAVVPWDGWRGCLS